MRKVFSPMDFDWRLSVSLVTDLWLKIRVVSTLGVLFSLGDQNEKSDAFRDLKKRSERAKRDRFYRVCDVLYPLLCADHYFW